MKVLNEKEKESISKGKCPDCKGQLLKGPHGGVAINVKCKDCENIFNIAQSGNTILFAERIVL
jgi:hypothetical protein